MLSELTSKSLQAFDIRVEVQAPANGSRPFNNGQPFPEFELTIGSKEYVCCACSSISSRPLIPAFLLQWQRPYACRRLLSD